MLLGAVAAIGQDGNKPYRVAIWLIPAQEQRQQIQRVINDLSAQYSSAGHSLPVFPPHMTLCTGVIHDKDVNKGLAALFDQIDTFVKRQEELSLAAMPGDQRIDERKQQWSQFLFLLLDKNDAPAEALYPADAQKAFPAIFNPDPRTGPNLNLRLSIDSADQTNTKVMLHVSLMYNGIEKSFPDIKQKVGNKNEYSLPDQIILDSIQVVTPRSGEWRDILREHPNGNGDWEVLYTRKLKLPKPPLRMVMAGGQTGVDQASWRAARLNRILIGGWCPPGRHLGRGQWVPNEFPCQETREDRDELDPIASEIPRSQRTKWNIRDADATLILRSLKKPECSILRKTEDIPEDVQADIKSGKDSGTGLTITHALELRRHVMICDPSNDRSVSEVVQWILQPNRPEAIASAANCIKQISQPAGGQQLLKCIQQPLTVQTLNVGGPSEATDPGIGMRAEQFLLKVFAQLRKSNE